jgi:hypothetical protein
MKLSEIPVNTVVELQFDYMGEKQKVNSGLLYKYSESVYVSAIKSAGEIIPAKKLKNFCIALKTGTGVYNFKNLNPRSVSFSGQNLYAVSSDQEANLERDKNANRLFVGVPISAKIITDKSTRYFNGMLKDISVNGMGILSIGRIEDSARIEVRFRVNADTIETLTGNIINSHELKNGKGYLYGCEFDEPNEIIGKYVARQQTELELMQ